MSTEDSVASRELRLAQAERMSARLDEGVAGVIEGAREAAERFDDLISERVSSLRAAGGIACAEGCAWCCRLEVSASFPEVARLADVITRTFTAEQRAALLARLEAHVAGRTMHERLAARRACPLLVNDRCSAYEARPLACRGWNSANAEACRADVESPGAETKVPVHVAIRRGALDVAEGIRDAASQRGLDDSPLDMPAALLHALQDVNGATQRWLAGEMLPANQRLPRRRREGGLTPPS